VRIGAKTLSGAYLYIHYAGICFLGRPRGFFG